MIRRVALGWLTFELSDEGPLLAPPPSPPAAPVALLHGFTGSKENWGPLRERLRESRRVLSFDLPGHGGTTLGDGAGGGLSMERCAAAVVEALVQGLGIPRFALVGYSMGGRLALAIALAHGGRVERLALESASAGIAEPSAREARRRSDAALAEFIETAGVEAFVARWERMPIFSSLANQPAEVRADLRRRRRACSAAGLAASLRAMGAGSQPWLGLRLGELRMPVMVIAGALDARFAAIGRELSAAIRGARLETIGGAGHVPHLERAAEFNRLVAAFLDGGPRRASP